MRLFRTLLLCCACLGALGCEAELDAPTHCGDGIKNGDESHRDCGGSCEQCDNGAHCLVDEDCRSDVCGAVGFCLIPTCRDSTLNGDESDIDCGGSCAPCEAGDDCFIDDDCDVQLCAGGTCAETSCNDNVADGSETDVDCGGQCGPCAAGSKCEVPSDCDSNNCVARTCIPASCDDEVINQGESDVDCGGPACDKCPQGLACVEDDDCDSGDCYFERCRSCSDGLQNGDETGRDCGGSCAPCRATEGCIVNEDCESKICDDGACAFDSCTDGVQNGDETDKDCGGPDCDKCTATQGCSVADDCTSLICLPNNKCEQETCEDGVQNGDESDIDCGGPTMCPRCRDYLKCTQDEDCAADKCQLNGYCGEQRCTKVLFHSTSNYRACGFVPDVALSCPNIGGTGTDSGISTVDSFTMNPMPLGFTFPYFERSFTEVRIQSHGALTFDEGYLMSQNTSSSIQSDPNDIIAVFWDDLTPERAGSKIVWQQGGSAPDRHFTVRWKVGSNDPDTTEGGIFSVTLREDGTIDSCYIDTEFGDPNFSSTPDSGRSATAAIFNGGTPFRYSSSSSQLKDNFQITYFQYPGVD